MSVGLTHTQLQRCLCLQMAGPCCCSLLWWLCGSQLCAGAVGQHQPAMGQSHHWETAKLKLTTQPATHDRHNKAWSSMHEKKVNHGLDRWRGTHSAPRRWRSSVLSRQDDSNVGGQENILQVPLNDCRAKESTWPLCIGLCFLHLSLPALAVHFFPLAASGAHSIVPLHPFCPSSTPPQ